MSEKIKNKNKPHSNICGAKAKSTGEPCRLAAGWGTDHPGTGKCRFHGGLSTGPPPEKMKKNKNAVKTGEYETIWLDTLDDKEKELYSQIRTDVIEQLDNEIRLTDIRIRRMMKRISLLKEHDFTVVEMQHKEGSGPEGPVDIDEEKQLATMGQIQNIEEALTRVQMRKEKLLKLKHTIEEGGGDDEEKLNQVVSAMMKAAGG